MGGKKHPFLRLGDGSVALTVRHVWLRGESRFGDCIAGVPLMYSDRIQIGRRTPASLLFPFYSSGSGGFFLAPSDHSRES